MRTPNNGLKTFIPNGPACLRPELLWRRGRGRPAGCVQRARADLLRGRVAFASSRGGDAPPLLLKAARQFEEPDVRLARETYLEALSAAL
jgi:hypothetical protein